MKKQNTTEWKYFQIIHMKKDISRIYKEISKFNNKKTEDPNKKTGKRSENISPKMVSIYR